MMIDGQTLRDLVWVVGVFELSSRDDNKFTNRIESYVTDATEVSLEATGEAGAAKVSLGAPKVPGASLGAPRAPQEHQGAVEAAEAPDATEAREKKETA